MVRIAWIVVSMTLVDGAAVAGEELSVRHPLTEDEIVSAIAIGNDLSAELPFVRLGAVGHNRSGPPSDSNRSGHFFEASQNRGSRTSGFGIELYTPYGWIAKIARDTARKGRELTPAFVNDELRAPVLRVICHTDVPQEVRPGALGNPVESVTLRATKNNPAATVEPSSSKRIPIRYRVPSGESYDIGPLSASFALDEVLALSALDKKGEFYVDIVAADGETKDFKIKSKYFDQLP